MVGLFSMFLTLATMPHRAAAGTTEDHYVSMLDRQTFPTEIKAGIEDVVVIFCDDAVQECKHTVQSFKQMTVIWKGTEQFIGSRFAEVSCTKDKELCEREGITAFPTALHYRNGIRLASWSAESNQRSPVGEFAKWVRTQLAPTKLRRSDVAPTKLVRTQLAPEISSDAAPSFSFRAPFADMDYLTAGVGWCMVLASFGVVAWVIVEGFELSSMPTENK